MASELRRRDPLMDDFGLVRRLFDRMAGWPTLAREGDDELTSMMSVPVDIYDHDDKLIVKAAVPGVEADDIHVDVHDGVLTIRAESRREEEVKEEQYHRREFRYGKIQRSFRLPPNVDAEGVEAHYDKGMLEVWIPHRAEAQPKKITVKPKA